MNLFQKILYKTYPLRMRIEKKRKPPVSTENTAMSEPPVSFYSLKATLPSGEEIPFSRFRGKMVLIVNVASNCGYTAQYEELQEIYSQHPNLEILAFPANNFGAQEPRSDEEILSFCKINYGVTFPVFTKKDVTGSGKQAVYKWLSEKDQNGWNSLEPSWNFFKYLIDDKGVLIKVAPPAASPAEML